MQDQLFVSYSREDHQYVTELADYLEERGVRVWYDADIDYGTEWEPEIVRNIDACAAMVVVMSASARTREWVRREIAHAEQGDKKILPLLLEEGGVLPELAHLQFHNVIGGSMPSLEFCRRLPGWRESQLEIEAGLSPSQSHMAERLDKALRGVGPGSDAARVGAVQVELIRVGLDPGSVDGVFGDRTRQAVRDFQRRRLGDDDVDGMFGPLTCASLVTSQLGDLAPDAG